MPEHDNEAKLAEILKAVYKPATASPEFRERLRRRLIEAAASQPMPRPLWFRPLAWAPVAAAVALGLIAYFVIVPLVSPTTSAHGSLEIYVTDAPGEVVSLDVTVSQVQVHRAGDDTADDDGWITVISENVTFDLIALRDVQQLLGEEQLEVGHYTQIRLNVDNVTVNDEIDANIKLPLADGNKLMLVGQFEIQADCTTALTLDFDAYASLVFDDGRVAFEPKPTVKLIVGEPCEEANTPQP